MSLVFAAPELMTEAATDLANIGSTVSAAHMAAATPTVAVIPAAADEVSSSIAHLFSQHAQDYQALAGQAAAFHNQFVQHLTSSASSYASAEAASAKLLQPLTGGASSLAAAASSAASSLTTTLTTALTAAIAIILLPIIGVVLLPVLASLVVAVGIALIVFGLGALAAGIGSLL
ncbi:MAG: PE family protein [Mycobacterium sp.]